MKRILTICIIGLIPLMMAMSNCGGGSPVPDPIPDPTPEPLAPTCENACKINPNYCGDWCDVAIDVPGFVDRLKCVVESESADASEECP
jgi:hypothetical protein